MNIFLCLISFHIGKGADITSARDTTKVAQIEGRFKTALLLDDITLVTITTKSNPPTHSIFCSNNNADIIYQSKKTNSSGDNCIWELKIEPNVFSVTALLSGGSIVCYALAGLTNTQIYPFLLGSGNMTISGFTYSNNHIKRIYESFDIGTISAGISVCTFICMSIIPVLIVIINRRRQTRI